MMVMVMVVMKVMVLMAKVMMVMMMMMLMVATSKVFLLISRSDEDIDESMVSVQSHTADYAVPACHCLVFQMNKAFLCKTTNY